MSDMNTNPNKPVDLDKPEATQATPNSNSAQPEANAQPNPESNGHGRCHSRHHHQHGDGNSLRGEWRKFHGKKRWKIGLGIFLIAFTGFMLGKASSHHHGHGHWERGMQQTPAVVVVPYNAQGVVTANPSVNSILDSIGATPEQRARAQGLYR